MFVTFGHFLNGWHFYSHKKIIRKTSFCLVYQKCCTVFWFALQNNLNNVFKCELFFRATLLLGSLTSSSSWTNRRRSSTRPSASSATGSCSKTWRSENFQFFEKNHFLQIIKPILTILICAFYSHQQFRKDRKQLKRIFVEQLKNKV